MTARILLVEDEPAIAEVIAFALRTEGFSVDCSALVREAEVILASAHFDLGFGGLLSCVFGVLYVLISLDDHALVAGALSLFAAFAVVMI